MRGGRGGTESSSPLPPTFLLRLLFSLPCYPSNFRSQLRAAVKRTNGGERRQKRERGRGKGGKEREKSRATVFPCGCKKGRRRDRSYGGHWLPLVEREGKEGGPNPDESDQRVRTSTEILLTPSYHRRKDAAFLPLLIRKGGGPARSPLLSPPPFFFPPPARCFSGFTATVEPPCPFPPPFSASLPNN